MSQYGAPNYDNGYGKSTIECRCQEIDEAASPSDMFR